MIRTIAALFAATMLAGTAHAADVIVDPVPESVAVDLPPSLFLTVKVGYGPSLIDNSFEGPFAGGSFEGEFNDDYLAGIAGEVGAFVNRNVRFSLQGTIGRIEHDQQDVTGVPAVPGNFFVTGPVDFDGHTKIYQGFVKAAYETRLSDIGLTASFFERSSIFGVGGVGLTHLRSEATVGSGALTGARSNDNDTVVSGLVGVGSVYDFTDNLSLISEANFIFGGDAELDLRLGQNSIPFEIETQAITFQTGLRFRF